MLSTKAYKHPTDPELICQDKELPSTIEAEIKEGFFELRQKFKSTGPSSIYISHIVLHNKHPLLKKIQMVSLKKLLQEAQVMHLEPGQPLYSSG